MDSLESNLDKMKQKAAVVIYHANCNDGFTAAWVFHRWYEQLYKHTEYIAANYGDELPSAELTMGRDVFILDFSYHPDTLLKLAQQSAIVELLDHHKTALEAWNKFWAEAMPEDVSPGDIENLHVTFDMNKSGAGLAWDRFKITEEYCKTPMLVLHAQDYDLWKFESPNTKPFIARLALYERTFLNWNKIEDYFNGVAQSYTTFVEEGKILELAFEKQCNDIIAAGVKEIIIGADKGLGCNAPAMFASRIGNILADKSGTFGATWFEDSNGAVRFSLRSAGQYDVSAIAKTYGGGGHRNAAGFTFKNPSSEPGSKVILWKQGE